MKSNDFPKTYFAVIFSSLRSNSENFSYEQMAKQMLSLAETQEGFLGVESARGDDGFGITISYWKTEESIKKWKSNSDHQNAQSLGRSQWYQSYTTRICKVEREYSFGIENA